MSEDKKIEEKTAAANKLSITNTSLNRQLSISFALMTLVPVMVLVYFVAIYIVPKVATHENILLLIGLSLGLSLMGFFILKKVIDSVRRFMYYIEAVANGELKEKEQLYSGPEMTRIVKSLNSIITKLRNDLDEQGALAKEREVTNEKLKKLDKLKDEFVSTVSHELRTPLTIMKEFTYIMLDGLGGKISSKQKEFLTIINNNIDRLTHIISNLLNISKIESGKITLNRQVTILPGYLRATVSALRKLADKKNIKIQSSIARKMSPVFIDKERMIEVLTNIVENAIKYTPDGGTIKVCAKESDYKAVGTRGFVEISIADTGEGIAKENLERIFERFHQVDRKAGPGMKGTGLGLAIAKSLVEMHQGRIWAKSDGIGKGSRFIFVLPKP